MEIYTVVISDIQEGEPIQSFVNTFKEIQNAKDYIEEIKAEWMQLIKNYKNLKEEDLDRWFKTHKEDFKECIPNMIVDEHYIYEDNSEKKFSLYKTNI